MRYPGGKNGSGTLQRLINQMPPHRRYIEPFCGSAAVLRLKRPAAESYAIDRDSNALDAILPHVPAGTRLFHANGIHWLEARLFRRWFLATDFVYLDPPYLPETRTSGPIYRYELTAAGHGRLLKVIRRLPCMVAISGYPSGLYDAELAAWRRIEWQAMTRGGLRTEVLWMNYPEPIELHDYQCLGDNFRQREKFSRQRKRWTARLARMNVLQRRALLAALSEVESGRPSPAATVAPGRGSTRAQTPGMTMGARPARNSEGDLP